MKLRGGHDSSTHSDVELIERSRGGDEGATAELWKRHHDAGLRFARATSSFDAEDLHAEAFARVVTSVAKGGGPSTGFRSYLYAVIRNTAAEWARKSHETSLPEADFVPDPDSSDERRAQRTDGELAVRAFQGLPDRWREVLWHKEIEGLSNNEIAKLQGTNANAVAQLIFRAREGIRDAWIDVHLQRAEPGTEHAWVVERLPTFARGRLGGRESERLKSHLSSCARCARVADEASNVAGGLRVLLGPAIASGGIGLAASQIASTSAAAVSTVNAAAPIFGHLVARMSMWGVTAARIVARTCLVASVAMVSVSAAPVEMEVVDHTQTAALEHDAAVIQPVQDPSPDESEAGEPSENGPRSNGTGNDAGEAPEDHTPAPSSDQESSADREDPANPATPVAPATPSGFEVVLGAFSAPQSLFGNSALIQVPLTLSNLSTEQGLSGLTLSLRVPAESGYTISGVASQFGPSPSIQGIGGSTVELAFAEPLEPQATITMQVSLEPGAIDAWSMPSAVSGCRIVTPATSLTVSAVTRAVGDAAAESNHAEAAFAGIVSCEES